MHEILAQARAEARALGSPRVEAEHLLLALSWLSLLPAGRLLTAEGLDHEAVLQALDNEFKSSLEAVGVKLDESFSTDSKIPIISEIRLAQSIKQAILEGNKARVTRRDSHLDSLHLLLGVLIIEGGTVARALDLAGVDRKALVAKTQTGLDCAA
jgi:ATP-dependent Clp protease ATP-binding subunit ClpA